MKFKIITFGCKVNSYESEFMREQLKENGYVETDKVEDSDVCLVNTCSVTNVSDSKCKKTIRGIKKENAECILIVCGCSSDNRREEYQKMDIDILLGNKDKSKIISILNNFLETREKQVCFYEERYSEFENMCINKFNLTRAFVKIQDGCNNFCAYCVIPYVRGNIRSKSLEEAVLEISNLVNSGYKEIVLTGINTGAYGKEYGNFDLVTLIDKITKLDNLQRIRISSIEMTEITDRFIEELRVDKKLCGHLHVSLQSGSASVLKRMGRKYTKDYYFKRIQEIRTAREDINLTTDVIVGFPGETDEEFLESVEFCKKVRFSKIHVFPYSIREGTKAAMMENQVANDVKKKRVKELINVSNELQLKYNESFLGKVVSVLIETVENDVSIGHTENFLKVEISEKLVENKEYLVILTKAHSEYLEGILANK